MSFQTDNDPWNFKDLRDCGSTKQLSLLTVPRYSIVFNFIRFQKILLLTILIFLLKSISAFSPIIASIEQLFPYDNPWFS